MSTKISPLSPITSRALNAQSPDKKKTKISTEKGAGQEEGAVSRVFNGLPQPFQKIGPASGQPYIGCNEEKQSEILQLVDETSHIAADQRVHVGFSVWFNLDLISVSKPAYAIICDVDNHVMEIYEGIQNCLLESESPDSFVHKFRLFLIENADRFFSGLPEEEISKIFDVNAELRRPGSWLMSQDKFAVIKSLHEKGRVLYLNLDITDQKGEFERIHAWMRDKDLALDTLYVSNIVEWLKTSEARAAYIGNLTKITGANTRFIQAYKPKLYKKGAPVLHLGTGRAAVAIPEQQSLTAAKRSPLAPVNILPGDRALRKIDFLR